MKTENEKENYFNIVRINFLLLLIFTILNNLDYFSTYLSIIEGGVEINPLVQIMLKIPLVFFIYKILILPSIVWYFGYDSDSRKVMWSLVVINLVYLLVVFGNLKVVL